MTDADATGPYRGPLMSVLFTPRNATDDRRGHVYPLAARRFMRPEQGA